ncbi:MAG: hypothetical protein ACMXYG_05140 [Candidatus Woesearchaeota archaeon]
MKPICYECKKEILYRNDLAVSFLYSTTTRPFTTLHKKCSNKYQKIIFDGKYTKEFEKMRNRIIIIVSVLSILIAWAYTTNNLRLSYSLGVGALMSIIYFFIFFKRLKIVINSVN